MDETRIRCIRVSSGKRCFYIPREQIRLIVPRPEIFKVPGAKTHIRGIAYYEGKLIPYYRLDPEMEHVPCGIVVLEKQSYAGICVERLMEETDVEPSVLEQQREWAVNWQEKGGSEDL